MPDPVPYQCFISYTRADNDDHDDVVDRLKRQLAGRFEAATGSRLEIFLDRDSIGWGERWREKIAEAIAGSTLFVPIITMRYFNSAPCRDEFSAFYSAAAQRGVTDLILPIVLAGSDQITSEHTDELVRAVAELNYQPISDAFEAGYDSSEWKRRIGQLVKGLQEALARAAAGLVVEGPDVRPSDSNRGIITEIDPQVIESHVNELVLEMYALGPIIEQIGNVVQSRTEGRDLTKMTTGQRAFLFGALAEDLKEPAEEFGTKASNMEATARRLDAELRALTAEMYAIDPRGTPEQLAEFSQLIKSQSEAVGQFLEQMGELERGLRMAALVSLALRKALSPMSAGLRSLETAMKIIVSWDSLGPSGTVGDSGQ